MIADLDDTIRLLLQQEMPIKNGEIEVMFDQPKREWSARLNRPTVDFFLYDVRENPTLRQHGWEQLNPERGDDLEAQLKRTPFRVDCFYMLTTWASDPEDEHRLLSNTLLTLFRYPVLPEERLVGSLKNQPFELQARLANHDRLTNPAEVWSALDNEMRPSISYIVTLAMDPWTAVTVPLVHTVTMHTGQTAQRNGKNGRAKAGLIESTVTKRAYFGGTVRGADGAPRPGIQVAVKGTGLFVTTDERGHYTLRTLPPGQYTLVAWPEEDRPREKNIHLPGSGQEYDIEI